MTLLATRLQEAMKGPPRMSNAALARACHISPSSVADWLNGRTKNLEGSNLLAAAEILNVNPKWLATGEGHKWAEYHLVPHNPTPAEASLTGPPWPFTIDYKLVANLSSAHKKSLNLIVKAFVEAMQKQPSA